MRLTTLVRLFQGQPTLRYLGFLLRREPLYHKIQYSKVPKFDAAAAILGVVIGAILVYLGLSSLGSAGADLTDLTVVCWYVTVWCCSGRVFFSTYRLAVASQRQV